MPFGMRIFRANQNCRLACRNPRHLKLNLHFSFRAHFTVIHMLERRAFHFHFHARDYKQ